MRLTRTLAVATVTAFVCPAAMGQMRVLQYNVAHLGGDSTAISNVLAAAHADNKQGWSKPVDVMIFQEVSSTTAAALPDIVAAAAPAGVTYARATYTTSGTEDASAGAQCAFYRVQTISEITSGHADIFTGAGRNADRWLFQLNGYTSAASRFYAYSMHLKASLGFEDERETGALAVRANANALGAGVRAFYVGDYNIYVNTEPAYLAMLASGNGQAFDPLGTGSWAGAGNAIKHTQSPRLPAGSLVGGGMDDRFDLHLITGALNDGEGIAMISGSYRSLGNDGVHFDMSINTGGNSYYPGEASRSNALALNLYNASDHIPVMVDYQVPAVMETALGAVAPRVIQGAQLPLQVFVSNGASVVTPTGADELDFVVTGASGAVGSASGVAPLDPQFSTVNLNVNTTTVGTINFEAQVTSSSDGAQGAAVVLPGATTVLSRSRPSWSSQAQQNSTTVPVTIDPSTTLELNVPLHNFGWTATQSKLDADLISFPAGSPVQLVGALPSGIAGTSGTVRVRVNSAGLAAGLTTVNASLLTSDENIPGEGDSTLSIAFAITVGGTPPRPGDFNNDGFVNATDLSVLLAQWGQSGSADVNGSGTVDGLDLAILLSNWG